MLVVDPSLPEVLPLFRALHNFHVCLSPDNYHANGADADYLLHLQDLRDQGAVIYAIDAGWGLVAYMLVYPEEIDANAFKRGSSRMTIDHLYIAPTHRGSGLGHQLIAALEADMHAKGIDRWLVSQDAINLPATDFYRAVGARPEVLYLEKRL